MKHILSTIIISSLIAVTASSCTGKFEEINSNPYQPGDLSEDDYALGSAMNNLAGCVVSPDVNTAQFTDCIIRKSKFPQNPKRSVRFSGKRTKRSVQKRKARNTQKAETKVL